MEESKQDKIILIKKIVFEKSSLPDGRYTGFFHTQKNIRLYYKNELYELETNIKLLESKNNCITIEIKNGVGTFKHNYITIERQ